MTEDFAFVFLEEADGVVFGVALQADQAEAVGADGEVGAGFFLRAADEGFHARAGELFLGDAVEAGVRDVEDGIHVAHERVVAVDDAVAIDAPEFLVVLEGGPFFAVAELHDGVGGEA